MHNFLTTEELYWVEMSMTPGWGAKGIRILADRFGSLSKALTADPAMWEQCGCIGLLKKRESLKSVSELHYAKKIAEYCQEQKIGILTPASPEYPPLLRQIFDPPAALYFRGKAEVLQKRCAAVVGSRNCTAYGMQAAKAIAGCLAAGGITVVSGMARGIDRAGHEGAIGSGGCTAAVLGCGVNVCYPPEHWELQDSIIENGVILSEFLPHVQAKAKHFPMRNRIISGLSENVIVVEAGAKSGSLITADLALDQNRNVYCVPGSFLSAANEGGHGLIRQGAALLGNIQDVVCLGGQKKEQRQKNAKHKENHWLLKELSPFGSTPEELCRNTGKLPAEIQQEIAFLLIEGKIRMGPDRRIMRAQEL